MSSDANRLYAVKRERLLNAVEFGAMSTTHEFRLGRLVIHSRPGAVPPWARE